MRSMRVRRGVDAIGTAPVRAGRVAAVYLALLAPLPAAAQGADSVTVVAGERYEAGRLHGWLLGDDYRALWTAPVRAAVLDLDAFAGGLDLLNGVRMGCTRSPRPRPHPLGRRIRCLLGGIRCAPVGTRCDPPLPA